MINITPARIVSTMLLASLVTFSASVFNHENCSTIAYADSQFTPVQGKVIYVPSQPWSCPLSRCSWDKVFVLLFHRISITTIH